MSGRPYDRRSWRRLRQWKLWQNPLCEECHAVGRLVDATEVDHIVPERDGGGFYDRNNLRAVCTPCHSRKTAAEDRGFGNRPGRRVVPGCDRNGTPLDPTHAWSDRNHGMPAAGKRGALKNKS